MVNYPRASHVNGKNWREPGWWSVQCRPKSKKHTKTKPSHHNIIVVEGDQIAMNDDDDREAEANRDADNVSDDDDDDDSINSCEAYINFVSIRDARSQLEEGISFGWPGVYDDDDDDDDDEKEDKGGNLVEPADDNVGVDTTGVNGSATTANERKRRPRKIVLSTLLEERDFAPLFDGASWAGTRLWPAAIRAVQYLSGILPSTTTESSTTLTNKIASVEGDGDGEHASRYDGDIDIITMMETTRTSSTASTSVLELGCGLGVPGMILHLLGCDVVLTDQVDILSQLEKNISSNFHDARSNSSRRATTEISSSSTTIVIDNINDNEASIRCLRRRRERGSAKIRAMPLSWSRDGISRLLKDLNRADIGFDVVLNCDCVYEPLYGKR